MNTCDLEEIKHQAKLKFLELMEKPEEWKPVASMSWYHTTYGLDTFRISRWRSEYSPGNNHYINISVDGHIIHNVDDHQTDDWAVQAWLKYATFLDKRKQQATCEALTKALAEVGKPKVVEKPVPPTNSFWWVKYVLIGGAVALVIQQVWRHI